MRQWLSAAEIARLGLEGLPASKRGINLLAIRAAWDKSPLARARAGNGGGLEFHLDLLPAQARADYVARHIGEVEVPASIAREAASEPQAVALSGPATEARDARLALIAAAERFAREAGLSRKRADRHFCDRFNAGTIEIAAWIKAEVKSLTPRTLQRWRSLKRDGKAARLAVDRAAARRGTGLLDRGNAGEVKTFLLALIAKQPQLTAHHLRALACAQYPEGIALGERRFEMPPVRTFQRALKLWRAEFRNELAAIRDPDGFKSKIRFSARVANPATRLNEVWQIDASPADALCIDGRHSIYICEDIYSRRLTALVSRTPRAAAVGLLLRKAILAWGVPERVKTDNGSDFVARETQRLLAALAIEHELSEPFQPQQKGHVERAIGTFQRGLMRTLPGFVGHSVADRKVIEGRKSFARRLGAAPDDMFEVSLTAAELQQRADEWCALVYGHAPHSSLKGQSPFAVAATYAGAVLRIEDERALDMLLAPVAGKDGLRTVTKTGLRINGAHYLAGFLNVGDEVHVRMDPADLGRAYVFSADALNFLGVAIAPELAGIDPAEAIARARAEQKRIQDERFEEVRRTMPRIRAKDIAPAIHRDALIAAGKLAEFPKPVETYDTPALAAARGAASDNELQPVHSPEVLAAAARLRAEEQAREAAPVIALRKDETPHQRWRRAQKIKRAMAEGSFVDPDDLLWLGGYAQGPEYRGFELTYGDASAATKSPAEAAGQG